MGAEPVEVAFEELYLALQQGTVDGQENPIVNIDAINLDEVQDFISLSSHQLSSNLVVMNAETFNQLSAEQQQAITDGVEEAMVREPDAPQSRSRRSSTDGATAAPSRSSRTLIAKHSAKWPSPS